MRASHLQLYVEEFSMKVFLDTWLTEFLPEGCTFEIFPYRGKPALLRKLPQRLDAHAARKQIEHRIVILVDRDSDKCDELKCMLEEICKNAGLRSKRASGDSDWQVVTRIAIEELEAWYFGDWQAVRAAYPRVPENIPRRQGYRDPDAIQGGTWEAFERILKRHGYFRTGLRKSEAARAIAPHIDPNRNRSRSFAVFRDAVEEAAS